ncbi:MAG: YdcF family protein [Pygmaiobacter sp.]
MLLTLRSNVTLGLLLLYVLSAALFFYLRFHDKVDQFCRSGAGRILRFLFFAGVCFFLFLLLLMASACRSTANGTERAVLVLGAGLYGDAVSPTLQYRLDAALAYHKQYPEVPILVSGAMGSQETRTEADAMQEYLEQRGVLRRDILVEDRATSTAQNFTFSAKLLQSRGISLDEPIVFITNNFHCYRAARYAAAAGFGTVHCLSVRTDLVVLLPAVLREALAICALWAKLL